jgi:2-iminobutanoate/2-iminopropanoate deaminase
MGTRVGDMIFSSGVMGKDPTTNKVAQGVDIQAAFMFQHMKTLVEAGGGSMDDVAHVTVFIKDDSAREPVNREWLKYFPDPASRPARHTLTNDLQHGMLVQLEFVAVLNAKS